MPILVGQIQKAVIGIIQQLLIILIVNLIALIHLLMLSLQILAHYVTVNQNMQEVLMEESVRLRSSV